MSRAALGTWAAVLALTAGAAGGVDPHMDLSLMPGSCAACHRGHGVSRSPMLPAAQTEVCLQCHDSRVGIDRLVAAGVLSAEADPVQMGTALAGAFTHPLSSEAFSSEEPGAVVCTSCHSPHRGMPPRGGSGAATGQRNLSPRDPGRFEVELCQSCHGAAGLGTRSPLDLSRLTNPNNPSYHPVEAPAAERSPSVRPELAGREINCTDCHGNSDPAGPRGPHASQVHFILRADYETVDGTSESETAYALCYGCHARGMVLDDSPFEHHRLHVVDERAACATCHSAHGSLENRSLIRFGEEVFVGAVAPSLAAGRLAFVSSMPGSGSCYLTCHGYDHAPESYGDEVGSLPPPMR
ncbi:MAG: cytochrome c3 family protein [Acidobacteriota bacterium]|nr:cytochrome c3 family protein [Acidobacteriota bacterium]MDH3524451.1 cytochrome c3 family protein [Acidobacteriota bacterium]